MFVKSTHFKQVCQLLLSMIVGFMLYVIEIHVAKVALGVCHLIFFSLAAGRSTSFKLVDHSPTHNSSKQRVSSYITYKSQCALKHFREDALAHQLHPA